MDFIIGDKEKLLIRQVAEFARKELPADFRPMTSIDQEYRDFEFEVAMSKKLAKKGWLVMSWPAKYGGRDATPLEQAIYQMECAYWGIPGMTMGISGVFWVGPTLLQHGTEDQKAKYLRLIASGDRDGYWCTGYSEPNAGSDLASLQTRAVRLGDKYVINGQKVWTSFAHHARWCWLMTRTDPTAARKHNGLTLFIVDMQSPGITIRPLPNYYGRHHFNEVFFDNVEVPAENIVGQENKGWSYLMQALVYERNTMPVGACGGYKRMLDNLVAYVKNTRRGGHLLSQDPVIRNKLVGLTVELEALRLLTLQLVWKLNQGIIPTYESSRNKVMSDDIQRRISLVGVEILGAYSQVDPDFKLARLNGSIQGSYLGFPANLLAAGTDEVEKSIIAQFKLGLPKSY